MRIGRYGIAFGRVFWFQTRVPTRVWHFLCFFWVFKEARPQDVDKKQQFPLRTPMDEGRVYRYWKAGEDLRCYSLVDDEEESK